MFFKGECKGINTVYKYIYIYMHIIQKSYALLAQIFKKFEKWGTPLGPNFFGTCFCQELEHGNIINHTFGGKSDDGKIRFNLNFI